MEHTTWTEADIPDQHGRVAVVTGATSGIGFETARALAQKGARVILAVRDEAKGRNAVEEIRRAAPSATLEVRPLDLADLKSIAAFVDHFEDTFGSLDLLINTAGVMAIPYRTTADGFEMQFGTNHLGHFALTLQLLPALLAAPAARIVTVSSINHRFGDIDWKHLNSRTGYHRWNAYAQSKLANLLFAFELQRRLDAIGTRAISVACHPGFTATNLQFAGPAMEGSHLKAAFWKVAQIAAQSAQQGALPTLYAATASDVNGCDYIGPTGPGEIRGAPGKVESSQRSHNCDDAERLWELSEQLTGVKADFTLPEKVAA